MILRVHLSNLGSITQSDQRSKPDSATSCIMTQASSRLPAFWRPANWQIYSIPVQYNNIRNQLWFRTFIVGVHPK